MEFNIPIKIHNRYNIEVKDVITGEIVQRGYAENIVLNNLFNGTIWHGYDASQYQPGRAILFGSGTGTLSPTRTDLFNRLGGKLTTLVELVANPKPQPLYSVQKIVLLPSEFIGATITEVGLGRRDQFYNEVYTHALIKDSEGNSLTLGPKTDTQEITIYSTVYFQPNFEAGVDYYILATSGYDFIIMVTLSGRHSLSVDPKLYVNEVATTKAFNLTGTMANGVISTPIARLETNENNGKIKKIAMGVRRSVQLDLEVLAQNDSLIWSGYNFDNTTIGTGTGSQTVFNLIWNEVRLDKTKVVYVDGIEQTSGVTWSVGSITFDTAPSNQAVITADYWVDYIPKDSDHVLDVQFTFNFGEGVV